MILKLKHFSYRFAEHVLNSELALKQELRGKKMEKKMVNVTRKLSILFLCFAWFICSCATIKKSVRPVVFQRSYEGSSAGEVYNGCIKAIQKRELPLLFIDKEARLISTDWIYFKKPGINLKYRYRFDLNISESTEKK